MTPSLSMETMMEKLGLKPWKEFYEERKKRIEEFAKNQNIPLTGELVIRQAGRTTAILLHALLEVQDGKIVFLRGYNTSITNHMISRAQIWAKKLGLNYKNIKPSYNDYDGRDFVGIDNYVLFKDHLLYSFP